MPGFSSTYSPLFLALFLIISAVVSYYFYRNSALSNAKKYFLIVIKTFAIFLLLSLFIEPVLSRLISPSNERLDVILVDNSRSNLTGTKQQEISSIINNKELYSGDKKVFLFSNGIKRIENPDSFRVNGFETDLTNALKEIRAGFADRNFNSITIISDGIVTSGGNPLYEAKTFQSPVITVPVGDSVQANDIVITGASYSEKAFTNTPVKVKVYFNVFGFKQGDAELNFYRENNLTSQRTIQLNGSTTYEAVFDITENAPGKIKYRVEAKPKEGELTSKNNYTDFYITYIDNKVNILVISGGPSYDDAAITGILKRINNYNITFRTAKSPGDFYEGGIDDRAFPELSAVFLLNYPTTQTASNQVTGIFEKINSFRIPVIFFAGKNSDYGKLQSLNESLPFSVSRPNSGESLFNLQIVAAEDNPVSKISGVNSTAQIFRNTAGIIPKPGAITLATDKFSGEPVMLTRNSGDFKSTAFLAYGLWRWRLNTSGSAEKTLEQMLLETINITLQKEKKTKVKIYPAKDIFDYTEQVKIFAEVFDENYLPTRNGSVTGNVLRKDGSKVTELKFTAQENRYYAIIPPLAPGDYTIEASAELNGSYYGNDNNRFSSDTLNTEYLETKTDYNLLNELSLNTGGKLSKPDEMFNVINSTKNSIPETFSLKSVRFKLWENKWFLFLIILLFTVEWVTRKRNNIP